MMAAAFVADAASRGTVQDASLRTAKWNCTISPSSSGGGLTSVMTVVPVAITILVSVGVRKLQ